MRLHCGSTKKRIWRAASFFAAILILSGTIFGVSIAIPQNVSATNDMAAEVVELINEIRAENGLSELTVYVELQQVADLRVSEIMEVFSHNRPDGTTCDTAYSLFGISTSACGENIAAGYSTAQSVVDGWMNSESHRANILNAKYTHIAVGLVYDASSEYKYYWVEEFSADYTVTATTTAETTTEAPTTTAAPTTTVPPTTTVAETTTVAPTTEAPTTTAAPTTTEAETTTAAPTTTAVEITTAAPTTTAAETTTVIETTTVAPTTTVTETKTVETTTVASTTTIEETTTEAVETSEVTETEETAEESETTADEDMAGGGSSNGKTDKITSTKAKIIGDAYAQEFSLPMTSEDGQSESSSEMEVAENIQKGESGVSDSQADTDNEGETDEPYTQEDDYKKTAESEIDAQGDSETDDKESSNMSFFDVLPWCIIALLVVVIGVLVIYIILMKRKKDEEDEDNEGENDNTRRETK